MKTREAWVDIIKGIGILAIVGSHAAMPAYFSLFDFAVNIMVPLFFFSAGYTYKKMGFKEMILKRIKRLLVPFVICNMIIVTIDHFIGFCYDWGFGKTALLSQYKTILTGRIPNGLCAPSWFLICIFIVYLIFWGIHMLLEKHPYIVTVICLACAVFVIADFGFSTSVDWGGCKIILNVGLGLFVFAMGWLCKEKNLIAKISADSPFCGGLFVAAVLGIKVIASVFEYSFDFRGGNANNPFFSLPVIITGLYAFVYLSVLISKVQPFSAILQRLGRNSLSIMLWHILCFQIVSALEIQFLGMTMDSWPNIYTGDIISPLLLTLVGTAIPILGIRLREAVLGK